MGCCRVHSSLQACSCSGSVNIANTDVCKVDATGSIRFEECSADSSCVVGAQASQLADSILQLTISAVNPSFFVSLPEEVWKNLKSRVVREKASEARRARHDAYGAR